MAADTRDGSLAVAQRSLADPAVSYPLWPPLTDGDPQLSTEKVAYPLEVAYDLTERSAVEAFGADRTGSMLDWQPLLPPLTPGIDLGVGGTPLLDGGAVANRLGLEGQLYFKDESRNPTWSHKDRLNTCTISAAALSRAPGVVVASSGNHGASAAALCARIGMPCVVIASAEAPPAIAGFLRAYGASVIPVATPARWPLMREIVTRLGFHPVSNLTASAHTGHPFGPEGYKTIAYECFLQLGRQAPAAVLVPCGYGELLFGVWKGFAELAELGLASHVPAMFAAEPGARAPLYHALATGQDVAHVAAGPTSAFSIGTTVGSYRAIVAVRRSGGAAVPVPEQQLLQARDLLARQGLWQELSGAAGLAALITPGVSLPDGPIVCVLTSSGFKDQAIDSGGREELPGTWDGIVGQLKDDGIL